jgi:aminopeptidase
MTDHRIDKLAKVLVEYSSPVQEGDLVVIRANAVAASLIKALYREVLRAGGHPFTQISLSGLMETFYREASDDQLDFISPVEQVISDQYRVSYGIHSETNTKALTNVDPTRQRRAQIARKALRQRFLERAARGEQLWTVTLYPTDAFAQNAEMSLDDFADFVYGACFLDDPDPVARWRDLSARQQRLVDWLKGKREVRVTGPHVDMTLSIEGRTFINSDGHHNFPSGEIFTGPVEDSVNGWVEFTYPAIHGGREVEGIRLRFENGVVVEASAKKNEDFLLKMLDTDEGARRLGEWAIGTNRNIQRFTRNILFDEKIGGTIHMALGSSYPETGGKNESAIHWDMICDMRAGGEIHVDGELFYRSGQFLI